MNRRAVLSLSALSVLALAWAAIAGPINPPAGPIAPSNKTLQEIFDKAGAAEPRIAINATNTPGDNDATPSLFKITAPGSYYLTGNITGVVGKHGIEIAASGVTLDLNGFELLGVPGMGDFDGVSATVQPSANIAVLNGSVRGWGGAGVDLYSQIIFNCRVERVTASSNFAFGIGVGHVSTISLCSVGANGGGGILVRFVSLISQCVINANFGSGISTGEGCTVIDNTSRSNSADGIVVTRGCLVRGNNCSDNGLNASDGAGLHATSTDNRIEGNNCTGADRGIDVDAAGNFIVKNSCSGNTSDWEIAANNVVGPVLDRRAPASAPISGFSGPSSLATTDPNANFSY